MRHRARKGLVVVSLVLGASSARAEDASESPTESAPAETSPTNETLPPTERAFRTLRFGVGAEYVTLGGNGMGIGSHFAVWARALPWLSFGVDASQVRLGFGCGLECSIDDLPVMKTLTGSVRAHTMSPTPFQIFGGPSMGAAFGSWTYGVLGYGTVRARDRAGVTYGGNLGMSYYFLRDQFSIDLTASVLRIPAPSRREHEPAGQFSLGLGVSGHVL